MNKIVVEVSVGELLDKISILEIKKYIITLSIPIFFANLAIPLVGIVDTALMGNSGSVF